MQKMTTFVPINSHFWQEFAYIPGKQRDKEKTNGRHRLKMSNFKAQMPNQIFTLLNKRVLDYARVRMAFLCISSFLLTQKSLFQQGKCQMTKRSELSHFWIWDFDIHLTFDINTLLLCQTPLFRPHHSIHHSFYPSLHPVLRSLGEGGYSTIH